jgi:hypothetical protein
MELSNQIPGVYDLKKHPDPDWMSWPSIAECFEAYHAVLVEKDQTEGPGWTAVRMQGT